MFFHDISGIKRSCLAGTGDRQDCQRISGKKRRKSMAVLSVPGGPQRRALDVRHTFEQRDQFLVFTGDPDEAG